MDAINTELSNYYKKDATCSLFQVEVKGVCDHLNTRRFDLIIDPHYYFGDALEVYDAVLKMVIYFTV